MSVGRGSSLRRLAESRRRPQPPLLSDARDPSCLPSSLTVPGAPHPQGLVHSRSSENRCEEPAPLCGGGARNRHQRLLGAQKGVGKEGRRRSHAAAPGQGGQLASIPRHSALELAQEEGWALACVHTRAHVHTHAGTLEAAGAGGSASPSGTPREKGHPDPTGPGPLSTAQPGLLLAGLGNEAASFVPLCWAVERTKADSRLASCCRWRHLQEPSLPLPPMLPVTQQT